MMRYERRFFDDLKTSLNEAVDIKNGVESISQSGPR